MTAARALLRNGWLRVSLAVAWLVAVALVYLAPALSRGDQLGDFELLSAFGLGTKPGVPLHNVVSSDQIQEMVPWTDLDWVAVHSGHLPFWNPFAGLGLPLAFNFQAASFSLPTDVAYLFPLHLAYTVSVVVKLLIAGTGALFLARVLGVRLLAATFAGTVFELSGGFTAWLGWPQSGVYCWLGWILGAIVLAVRSTRPARSCSMLAVTVALMVLGGHPESIAITLLAAAIFALVLVLSGDVAGRIRAVGRLALALVGSALLSAPLLLPSLQVVDRSSHTTSADYYPMPAKLMVDFAVATFDGQPILHHPYEAPVNYYSAAVYVGLGVLVLAGVALVRCWRKAEVVALGTAAVVCLIVSYSRPVGRLLDHLPRFQTVMWQRAVMPVELFLAVLAAVGLQLMIDRPGERSVRVPFAVLSVAGAVLVAGLAVYTGVGHFSGGGAFRHERIQSLIVPGAQAACGLVAVVLVFMAARPRKKTSRHARPHPALVPLGLALVVAGEVAFLVTATPDLWSSSSQGFVTTPAERTYEALVGDARVGFGACPSLGRQPDLGILAEANSAYGVAELAAYDPVVPTSWFQAYGDAIGDPKASAVNNFCPSLTSVALAREFGVSYVLEPPGAAGPAGTERVATIAGEGLYRVPDSGVITVASGSSLADVPYTSSDPSELAFDVNVATPSVVRIHISDLPGWTASVDGHRYRLSVYDHAMMQLRLPAGRHHVSLEYYPGAWTDGLWLALASGVGLAGWIVTDQRRRRHRPSSPAAAETAD